MPVKLGDPAEAESSSAKFFRKLLNNLSLNRLYSISLNVGYITYCIEHNKLIAVK
jgi:hypothetical protein